MTSAHGSVPGCRCCGRRPSSFCALIHQAICRGGKRASSISSCCTTRLTRRSWSSLSSTWKPSGRPASCQCRRSRRCARPWKVPIHSPRLPGCEPPRCNNASARARISPAALLVKVTAKIPCAGTPKTSLSQAMRWVSTRVLPEPAPASTRWWPGGAVTASRWAGFSASSRYETSIAPFYVAPRERPPLLDGLMRADDVDERRTRQDLRQQRFERLRTAEQETLQFIAAALAQPRRLLLGFHALGDDLQFHQVPQADDRGADRGIVGIASQVLHEGPVDLQPVDG